MEWEFQFSVAIDGPYEQLGAAGGMTWEGAARNLAQAQGRRLGYGFYRIRLLADEGPWATARRDKQAGFEFIESRAL